VEALKEHGQSAAARLANADGADARRFSQIESWI
jgi:hypothetical protein